MIRTGRGRYWDDPEKYYNSTEGDPGPGADGGRWLRSKAIGLAGSDTTAFEAIGPHRDDFGEVHLELLGAGVPIVENLNLEPLAEARIKEFLFIMAPLKIVGGTGSPVRPLAVA